MPGKRVIYMECKVLKAYKTIYAEETSSQQERYDMKDYVKDMFPDGDFAVHYTNGEGLVLSGTELLFIDPDVKDVVDIYECEIEF